VSQALELSRPCFLEAIQSLRRIIRQFGTDLAGDTRCLKA
jgi:hypothetical protein